MRNVLVTALAAQAGSRHRSRTLRFLDGLSGDELLYIAEFVGCCVLEESAIRASGREEMAASVARFEQCRIAPGGHKSILLLEYLCRSGSSAVHLSGTHSPRVA